ncbi:PAAR domain-containing protein [Pseudacidovorax intermedius]|uniref:PAAR domain-containing protein n=1 Tax=Pseudacidovorax intermedius TaxID=433924 RepID=UPI0011C06420|nr:PAAR domain-containing protein [Pseudacidovorax intermedius]
MRWFKGKNRVSISDKSRIFTLKNHEGRNMYYRALIREGDTLKPGGGLVQPKPQQYKVEYFGKLACFEGDPVFCNACKTWGVTKCVPPYRPQTDAIGRQANLDGDLCMCKCAVPPRLKATLDTIRMCFEPHEIVGDAVSWFIGEGHDPAVIGMNADQRFVLVDSITGQALAGSAYVLECDGMTVQGVTDLHGMTQPIYTRAGARLVTVFLQVE